MDPILQYLIYHETLEPDANTSDDAADNYSDNYSDTSTTESDIDPSDSYYDSDLY